jgi:3'(2'), 5'-bisphosphate nucleotidase
LVARDRLAVQFGEIASEAGRVILTIAQSGLGTQLKDNGSPVTKADVAAEQLIHARLATLLPGIRVVAEESFEGALPGHVPERFLLVDPLDGTREFIAGRDEYTVNIALVDRGAPIVGCVYAPAKGSMYIAGGHAYRCTVRAGEKLPNLKALTAIQTSGYPEKGLRAVASRSHLDPKTQELLARLPVDAFRSAGSSLKFCVIAEGGADVYPRLAPTMEWDTAAGQAVLNAAGGCVVGLDGMPLRYGKTETGFKNDAFVAWGRAPLAVT